jgi:hypothetical protein
MKWYSSGKIYKTKYNSFIVISFISVLMNNSYLCHWYMNEQLRRNCVIKPKTPQQIDETDEENKGSEQSQSSSSKRARHGSTSTNGAAGGEGKGEAPSAAASPGDEEHPWYVIHIHCYKSTCDDHCMRIGVICIVRVHLVTTLLHQAHLSPLPQTIRPIYWNFDHALRLYPLPHALVIGDSTDPWYVCTLSTHLI